MRDLHSRAITGSIEDQYKLGLKYNGLYWENNDERYGARLSYWLQQAAIGGHVEAMKPFKARDPEDGGGE